MNTQQLIYNIITFFFDDIWHLIELILLIYVIKGNLKFIENIKKFITKVKLRYKARILAEEKIEKMKEQIPNDYKKIINTK